MFWRRWQHDVGLIGGDLRYISLKFCLLAELFSNGRLHVSEEVKELGLITADEVKKRFAKALNSALINKYGSRQSAASVAREFALLPGCRSSVSAETTRKWLKGIVFPDLENLVLLCNWLDLDMSSIFKSGLSSERGVESGALAFGRRASDRNFREAFEILSRLPDARADLLIKLIRQIAEI